MSNLYIYYRVRPEAQTDLLPRLHEIQQALVGEFGVVARVMRKCDDEAMLMEVYEEVGDADRLLAALDERLRAMALHREIVGDGRHVERFECA